MSTYRSDAGKLYQASEDEEQAALFEWARSQSGKYPCLERMYHVPNGGKRSITTAKKMKRLGVKRGVPDIVLPAPRGIWHGLYIELKRQHDGTASQDQLDYIDYLNREGYYAVICHGWESAVAVIKSYLTSDAYHKQ